MNQKVKLIQPKIFVNGFPKAGTHLALNLIMPLAKPWQEDGSDQIHYFGTFAHNSFSDVWMPKKPTTYSILCQPPGTWLKGHCGHFPELEMAFNEFGTCMLFIYRDLRDVAVSMVYHIEETERDFKHADRELYLDLPDREARLIAIIEGIGHDPGLVKRWEYYAPWLDVDWVLPLRFEDVIADKEGAVHQALHYCIGRTAEHYDVMPGIEQEQYDALVERAMDILSKPKEYSKTFRKGTAGQWRDEFTPPVLAAFDEAGGNVWNEKLGYAQNN